MAGTIITQDIMDAILAGTLQVTRRSEIYESDGSTTWLPSSSIPRIVSGAVSVDGNRAERRTLEASFDNSDGVLKHDPEGFWYDKVIKVYRGIKYINPRISPRILLVDNAAGSQAGEVALRKLGFTDVTINLNPTSLEDFYGYDILVSWHGGTPNEAKYDLLESAYQAGFNIFTYNQKASASNVPLIVSTTDSVSGTVELRTGSYDSPARNGFADDQLLLTTTNALNLINTVRSTAHKALNLIHNSTTYIGAVHETNQRGARWFQLTQSLVSEELVNRSSAPGVLISNIINWLFSYKEILDWEIQIGEFMIDRITEDSKSALISVTGRDYVKKLLGSKFANSVTFGAGLAIDTVVSSIAANAGVTKFIGGSGGATIANSIPFDRTTERWKAIQDICTSNGIEVYFDPQGFLVTRQFRDPVSSPTVVVLEGGANGNLVSFNKSSNDSRVYNVVVVTGENAEQVALGNLFQATAANTEPSSPTRVSRLGERHYFYTSAFFTSNEQCQIVADNLLSVLALEEYELNFESLAFPWLEAGEILEFLDPTPDVDVPRRFLLTQFSIPLSLGPMSGNAKRVTIVGAAN